MQAVEDENGNIITDRIKQEETVLYSVLKYLKVREPRFLSIEVSS